MPVAIGGVGGSGTRVVAALLQRLGYYIGADVNKALDNLWFTLLFKRRAILLETHSEFSELCAQFWARMEGQPKLDEASRDLIAGFARRNRMQHQAAWLQKRADTWFSTPPRSARPWGWKEPNTHLLIDRLFDLRPELRYIHVGRNPLDMALSTNQNQLEYWGAILLGRGVEIGPRDALSYCCAVMRRIERLSDAYPGRICKVDFDQLCDDPATICQQVADFLGTGYEEADKDWFCDLVQQGAPVVGRHKRACSSHFAPTDLHYAARCGYVLG